MGKAKDLLGEFATGVSAAAKGNNITGITIDPDGNPTPDALVKSAPATLHTGHAI